MIHRTLYLQAAICILLIFGGINLLCAQSVDSTQYTFTFRGTPLPEVLDVISREVKADLVYDSRLVRGHTIYSRVQNEPFPHLLNTILKKTGLDYLTLSSGTHVIVKSVEEKPAFGLFSGRVSDAETGQSLSGATVLLADAGEGTATNARGYFSIPKLTTGKYTIIFSYIGYEPRYETIEIEAGENLKKQIQLNPSPSTFAPVVVESHRRRLPEQAHHSSINPQENISKGGLIADPIRSMTLSPGIQYGLPLTDLHLQGGQQGEHRIMLDGIPIYNPFSFGRLFGAFSPFAIDRISSQKAGFGVQHGSQIAGTINLDQQVPESGTKQLLVETGPVSANAKAAYHLPLDDKKVRMMTAIRSSIWDIFEEPNLQQSLEDWNFIDPLITNTTTELEADAALFRPELQNSDVRFQDYHIAAEYNLNDFSTLSATFYYGKNRISTELLNKAIPGVDVQQFLFAKDSYEWNNLATQLSWDAMISPRFDLSALVSLSSNDFDHSFLIENRNSATTVNFSLTSFESQITRLPTRIEGNDIRHITSKLEGSYHFKPGFIVNGGLQLESVNTDLNVNESFSQAINTDEHSLITSGYLESEHIIGEQWNMTFGTRLTHQNSTGNKVFLEPRASIQYDAVPEFGFLSARVSGGVFRQFITQNEITNIAPTSVVPSLTIWTHTGNIEVPKAYHLSGSLLAEPAPNTSIKLETFYKWQPQTNITSYANLNSSTPFDGTDVGAFAETTSARLFGTGIRINQHLEGLNIDIMAGYDYSFSRIDFDTQFGKELPAPWNNPHRTQTRILWWAKPEFAVLTKWQGTWGRKWAFRPAYYNFLLFQDPAETGGFSFDSPENDLLSPFQQVDLAFIYQPSLENVKLEVRLNLINILDRKNAIDQSLVPSSRAASPESLTNIKNFNLKERTMPGFYPSLSAQIGF